MMESLVAAAVSSSGSSAARKTHLLVAGNLSLLCWTIYLAGQFASRTKQEVSKARGIGRTKARVSEEAEGSQEQTGSIDRGDGGSGEEMVKESHEKARTRASHVQTRSKEKYDLVRHLYSLVG